MKPVLSFAVSELGQIALTVSEIGPAIVFYRGVLGLKLLSNPSPELAFFSAGGIRLMLSTPEIPGDSIIGRNSVLYFRVTDIHAVQAALQSRGAKFEDEPRRIAQLPDHDLWMTFLRDPDQNLIGLMSEIRQG